MTSKKFYSILQSLGLLALFSLFTSCKQPQEALLSVTTKTLSISVGEQVAIQYTVTPKDTPVTFVSDHPEIASVNEGGTVSGVSEGQCTLTVKAGSQTRSVAVTVATKEQPKPKYEQEMPLLKFDVAIDSEGHVTDPEVLAYEESLTRKAYTVHHSTGVDYYGFANPELSTITATLYGLSIGELAHIIAAYSTEPLEACPKTREMLNKLGFTTIEEIEIAADDKGNMAPALRSVNDNNPKLTAYVIRVDYPELKAQSYIEFIQERGALPPYVAHEILTDAKDFPTLSAFKSKDAEGVKAFEAKLALRTQDVELSLEGNLWFDVKEECEGKTNIDWAYYVFTPEGGDPFINIQLLCIGDTKDIQSDAFKQYLETNGFNKDYAYQEGPGLLKVYNAHGDMCQVFLREFDGRKRCLMQIVPQKN